MFSPRSTPRAPPARREPSAAVASDIAIEYANLKRPECLPRGVYVVPSAESICRWEGVIFVYQGPYARAVLRFSLGFDLDFPISAPTLQFDTHVYHSMVNPKTRVWTPRGSLARWQSRVHHVSDLLHSVVDDFTVAALDSVTEEQAINKQLYSLYRTSRHTFLSMTAQRSLRSISHEALYPSEDPQDDDIDHHSERAPRAGAPEVPVTPTKSTSKRVRLDSGLSSASGSSTGTGTSEGQRMEDGMIRFRPLGIGEKEEIEHAMRIRMWDFLPPEPVRGGISFRQ